MKVLHLSAVKNWGGGENHIENLCRELNQKHPGIQNIIFLVKNGDFHTKIKDSDLPYITAPLAIKIDIRYALKLGFTCLKEKIDLIHIHDPTAIMLAIMADKMFNLPPFVFSKKTSFPIKQRKSTLYKYNYPKIRKILCVSQTTCEVSKVSIEDKDKLEVIYHGTNFETKSSITPYLLREKLNIDQRKLIIGCIANHIRAKNLETFVQMANILSNEMNYHNLHFVQIGAFTDRTENLKKMVNTLNLEPSFHFLGSVPNASNFLPQFDVMVLSSQSEGIPQVIYEAMYHRVPVVSTDVGGIPEVIQHKSNGLLSPMHKPRMLAENVSLLLKDSTIKASLVEQASQSLTAKFSTSTMAEKTLSLYKEVLKFDQ